VLNAGDFFGEIAVLTGRSRTANVDTVEATRLLQIPAAVLREIMQHPTIQRVVVSKLMERMLRMDMLSELGVANVEQGFPVEPRTSGQGQST
jgi:CRP-like cAMP-binding protein